MERWGEAKPGEGGSVIILFIGVQLLYNSGLVSAVQHRQSAKCVHMFPPSGASFPTPPR